MSYTRISRIKLGSGSSIFGTSSVGNFSGNYVAGVAPAVGLSGINPCIQYSSDKTEYLNESDKKRFLSPSLKIEQKYRTFEDAGYVIDDTILDLMNSFYSKGISGAYIAGSSVAFSIIGEFSRANDIDIFFKDFESFSKVLDHLFDDHGYSVSKEDLELINKNPSSLKFINLRPPSPSIFGNKHIQLVKMVWYDSPWEVINSFDLTCIKFVLSYSHLSKGQLNITYTDTGFEDLLNKTLVVEKTLFPVSLMRRIKKFADRGFTMVDGNINDLFPQLDKDILDDEVSIAHEQENFDPNEASWKNPLYRNDYYTLDAISFKRKWENR